MALHNPKSKMKYPLRFLCLAFCVSFIFAGCGSGWKGRIVYLDSGMIAIQSQSDTKINQGRKILIYRQETVTHPITGETLGTIRDEITEASALLVMNNIIIASAKNPWFEMIKTGDYASAIHGSGTRLNGFIKQVGNIKSFDDRIVYANIMSEHPMLPGENLTVIKYSGIVSDPGNGKILAVIAEPAASLRVVRVNGLEIQASYELKEKKLGWIENGDAIVQKTGDLVPEPRWFQEPPEGFSETWLFHRNYLHAIRLYEAGQYREAILEISSFVQKFPDYKDVSYLLGLCYLNINRYDEASAIFKKLLEQKKNDAGIWTSLAYTYLKQEKLKEASECYENLSVLLPDNSLIWSDLGDIYSKLGYEQKADQAYKKAQEANVDSYGK